jgi:hypothetical protein
MAATTLTLLIGILDDKNGFEDLYRKNYLINLSLHRAPDYVKFFE